MGCPSGRPTARCAARARTPGSARAARGSSRRPGHQSELRDPLRRLHPSQFSSSINLASDAVKGSNSVTLVSNPGIQSARSSSSTTTPTTTAGLLGPNTTAGSGSPAVRSSGSIAQPDDGGDRVNGTTITFATPFHITSRPCTRRSSRYAQPVLTGPESKTSISTRQGGDGHGNLPMSLCAYCWIKNVESTGRGHLGRSTAPIAASCGTRTSTRPRTRTGGAATWSASITAPPTLVENNIMWYGNKVIVMRVRGRQRRRL